MEKSNIKFNRAVFIASGAAVMLLVPEMAHATEAALQASTDALSTAANGVYDVVDSVAFRAMLAVLAGGLGVAAWLRGPSALTVAGTLGAGGAAVWAPDVMLAMAGTALLQ